jgi:hypothetical protein
LGNSAEIGKLSGIGNLIGPSSHGTQDSYKLHVAIAFAHLLVDTQGVVGMPLPLDEVVVVWFFSRQPHAPKRLAKLSFSSAKA